MINIAYSDDCISPIYKIEPPICSKNNIGILGMKETLRYGKLFFNDNDIIFSLEQKKCILSGPLKISQDIKKCVRDLTINNYTYPEKVARGLALNENREWVSACSENMPCIEFNNFVYNGTFRKLINYCNATDKYNKVLKTTDIELASWYGFKYCQHRYPNKCLYQEKELCSKNKIYPCPVSRWIYAANFILIYMLDPEIASHMPNCRII